MKKIAILIIVLAWFQPVCAQRSFVVDAGKIGAKIQPDMYGVFFEDINFGADGGLYAELIKNRSFEFDQPFVGWIPFGDVKVMDEDPCFDRNPRYVRLNEKGLRRGTGLENVGFTGIGFKQNDTYRFSFYGRSLDGAEKKFRIELISNNNTIGKGNLSVAGSDWKKYECTIKAGETSLKGKIRLVLETAGEVDLDHISLFPTETWKNRENGLRKDLVEALYDLNPGVFRFPGGCIIEGNTLETRYQWKNSVGPVENRPLNENRWNYTFKHRFFPDYYQSYGLGFYEFFLLSEDLGAEPLPVVSCGLACQYESTECVAVGDLQPYIDDAVDLIEFANGPADSEWGKVRAEMGHPEPFHLKYLAVGNEQWGEGYVERLIPFMEAIRGKYPEIKIVGTAGPTPEGENFDYLWPKMKELKVDLVDEHYYRSPEWFLENAERYDSYDRNGPKVFAGEYAAHPKSRDNNVAGAIAEAAFMTGLERNADVVQLATYAPLFAHVDAWQWKPDMIWFDNLNVVRTPNYYVQQMYAQNVGTNVLSILQDGNIISGADGLYASSCIDKNTSEIIVKVVNASADVQDININLTGLKGTVKNGEVLITCLHSNVPEAVNTLEAPNSVVPTHTSIHTNGNEFQLKAQGNAFYVCKLKIQPKK
ncbi:alpha-L-arabinofuranosidase C-terminal domain-containing protein [Maribellus sp. YY47]|uniref:alpha-L-arabinofuranosidase C-terminal domain-containing protein n=1 Tax=Maribellus sp. YY47 TaxID=2929486 RepID=UPI0020008F57|nr:alpha-L-arabinofuranosidase C-terminal domain-containing protein [Maribellus sp. YY47]MCK3684404.1 carbohydrate binding domain-containing protein [Maribellus sp. YY47]